jgi:transcriptional regulator with PAS, ATPase and Fis domain
MTLDYDKREYLGLDVIFASSKMRTLLHQAEQVAESEASVLIGGESGAGKEVLARAIHHHSRRRSKSWVDINCTALPQNLLESELFGYERGAFSGADTAKPGLFDLAHQGTLFLDEIGDLDLALQVKLLRVLDGSSYYRLGGVKKVHVDVRIVTATNRDLRTSSTFRRDLYHRLSQVRLSVPPLRERRDDIVPLATYFLGLHRPGFRLTHQAVQLLESHDWPGNVRELRNVVIQASVFARNGEVTAGDIPEELHQPRSSQQLLQHATFETSLSNLSLLGQAERVAIARVLEETRGNQLKAAERLGISRRTLQRRIKDYGLTVEHGVSVRVPL